MTPEEIKKKNIEQFEKAIEILDELAEENLTQEERDRRNWKFAGVKFIKNEGDKEWVMKHRYKCKWEK